MSIDVVKGFDTPYGNLKYDYKSLKNNNDIAPIFDNTATYEVGDYVHYNGQLYRCILAVTTAGDWNANNWIATTICDEIKPFDIIFTLTDASNWLSGGSINKTVGEILSAVKNGKYIRTILGYMNNSTFVQVAMSTSLGISSQGDVVVIMMKENELYKFYSDDTSVFSCTKYIL